MFLGLNPTFVEVTKEKLVTGAFLPPPLPPQSWIGLKPFHAWKSVPTAPWCGYFQSFLVSFIKTDEFSEQVIEPYEMIYGQLKMLPTE